jgi:hypothetical protein
VADHGLEVEPVQRGPEDFVVVDARREAIVELRLLGLEPVHDALIQVGIEDAPHAEGEVDVVRVVDLGQVIHAPRKLRVEDRLFATVVLDVEVTLLDVDVPRAVFAHRSELDRVGIGRELAHRPQDVRRVHDVV